MSNNQVEAVKAYFHHQNDGSAEGVTSLFAEDGSVYNVNLPPVRGREGITAFCQNLYARTSARKFSVLTVATSLDTVMAEWTAELTFRPGAKVGPVELASGFTASLRGVNKFEFAPGTDKISTLRVFHETSTVAELARSHAKNP
jgi:limonene-1,2-epoxide hydrolase